MKTEVKISPLTGAETLEQICFFCTKCYDRLTRFEKAKKNVEGIKGRSPVFISSLKTIKRKVKRQRADQRVVLVENVAHAPEQITTTKRVFNCKIFKVYRDIGSYFGFLHTDQVDKIEG